jgi:hypothetical protein
LDQGDVLDAWTVRVRGSARRPAPCSAPAIPRSWGRRSAGYGRGHRCRLPQAARRPPTPGEGGTLERVTGGGATPLIRISTTRRRNWPTLPRGLHPP